MNKSEILNLHTLSEDEQTDWLIGNEVLQPVNTRDYTFGTITRIPVWESLADCAFRLRDEWVYANSHIGWDDELHCFWCDYIRLSGFDYTDFMNIAKPIRWIQAALLAKLEKGKNDEI